MVYSRRQPGDWRALSLIWGVEIPLLTWASPRDGADIYKLLPHDKPDTPVQGDWMRVGKAQLGTKISLSPCLHLIADGTNWFQETSKVTTQLPSQTLGRSRQRSGRTNEQPEFVGDISRGGSLAGVRIHLYAQCLRVSQMEGYQTLLQPSKQLVTPSLARISG